MKVLGVFGGIGSMMIGAKQQGYEVIGNIEERPMFFTGTFEANFLVLLWLIQLKI